MIRYFRPKFAARNGVEIATIGTTTFNLTPNATLDLYMSGPPATSYIEGISYVTNVNGNDADGTITATLYKYDVSAAAEYVLTGAINMETLVPHMNVSLPILSTVTDAQRVLEVGDSVIIRLVSDSAVIDTQPQIEVTVELAVLA